MLKELARTSYPFIVTSFFILAYFFIRFKLRKAERKKLKSIKRREFVDAVETESPLDDQDGELREKGIHGIEDRFSFIYKLFPILLITLWITAISIPYLGKIPSVYISLIAAIVSVIVGVSLRPFLENLFSGVVISFFKSIKVGDTVMIDGHYGLIEEIGLTYSVLKRWDWNRVVIPNGQLLQKEIQNLTMNDHFLWTHVEFFVSPDADIKEVEVIAKKVAKESAYFHAIEEPSFWVIEIQKDTVKCWVAAWARNPSDAWELRHDIRLALIHVFKQNQIKLHVHELKNN